MFETHNHNQLSANPKSKGRALTILFVMLVALVASASTTRAQGTAFMYQGRLTDAGANANGLYDLEFKLYNAAGAQVGAAVTREDVQVMDGVFTVQLDFGQPPFTTGAANTLEIGVRAGASVGPFTALAPRQSLTSSPYAIQTINAAQLGGVPADQYVKTDDPRLSSGGGGGGNYIQNTTTQQTGANFNISGNGLFGGSVGINATPPADIRLQIDGNTQMITGTGTPGNRYRINLGSPNTETGLTLIKPETGTPTGRADLRFDGSKLKLVVSTGGIPLATNGIAIDTAGNVGIGTASPTGKLHVSGGAAVFDGNVVGSGNGVVKAMVYVTKDGLIARCYNGLTNSSSNGCGFTAARKSEGVYEVNLRFDVTNRFVSASLLSPPGLRPIFRLSLTDLSGTTVSLAAMDDILEPRDVPFFLIVY